eukprot:1401545-Pyramimonas_sp.AAC.1
MSAAPTVKDLLYTKSQLLWIPAWVYSHDGPIRLAGRLAIVALEDFSQAVDRVIGGLEKKNV